MLNRQPEHQNTQDIKYKRLQLLGIFFLLLLGGNYLTTQHRNRTFRGDNFDEANEAPLDTEENLHRHLYEANLKQKSDEAKNKPIKSADKPPTNILIVITDDLSATAIPPYIKEGHPMYAKNINPRLHEFLNTATAFHGVAPMTVCGPSRASFLTGRYIDRLDIYNFERYVQQAAPNISTMFKYFKDNLNYESFISGKVFHTRPEDSTKDIEFSSGHLSRPRASVQSGNSECNGLMYCNKPLQSLADTDVVNQLGRFLADMAKRPNKNFIAGAGLHRPHLTNAIPRIFLKGIKGDLPAYNAPEIPGVNDFLRSLAYKEDVDSGKYRIKFSSNSKGLEKIINPPARQNTRDLFQAKYSFAVREMRRQYYASIRFTFSNLGKILDLLETYGFKDNTHVIFLSDHGWQNGERGILGKNTLFPEATRVPLFIHYAGQNKSYFNKHPVSLRDIYPTLIELVHGKQALTNFNDNSGMPLDGKSLVPALNNPEYTHGGLVFSQYPRCQAVGQIQTEDCMVGSRELSCSNNSNRPKISMMGYTTFTFDQEYTEWRRFNEVRTGFAKPTWANMPKTLEGTGCMWAQLNTKLTTTDWRSDPIQAQLHRVVDGKLELENLAVDPNATAKAIIDQQSNRLKNTLGLV